MSEWLKKTVVPIVAAVILVVFAFSSALVPVSADTAAAAPDASGMKEIITEKSQAKFDWGSGMSASFSFDDETGGTFSLPYQAGAMVGAGHITYDGVYLSETLLTFTAHLPSDDWLWNVVVFRGSATLDDFTALVFRRGGGHITLLSRVGGIWYSYADTDGGAGAIVLGIPTVKEFELGTSSVLSGITGDTVDMAVHSTSDSVKVYAEDQLIYESPLTKVLPSVTGLFSYNAANSNFDLTLSNLRCYTPDYSQWNNAVNEESVVYSPFGGGGAQSEILSDGATLTAGSSKDGTALFTGPDITAVTVQTYSFTLDTSLENIWQWYTVFIRASADMEDYLVFRIRRAFGQFTMFGHINGYNLSYAVNEPFESENIPVFPIGLYNQLNNIEEGTVINLTVVSDEYGCYVFNGGEKIYEVVYSRMGLTAANGQLYGLDLSELPSYINQLPPVTGMYGRNEGYFGAEYSGVNCFYEGEKLPDAQKDSFLKEITYKGQTIEGFTPGSFEYDVVISGAEAVDEQAVAVVPGSGVDSADITWRTDEKSGYRQAVIAVKAGETEREYILTFEVYDAPEPFEREEWETRATGSGCSSSFETTGICCSVILLAGAILILKRCMAK